VLSSLNSVLRLNAQTGTLTLVSGNGLPGFSGDNSPAASASLNEPFGVAVDSAGNVYIADTYNNRVRKVSNGMITTVAGNGTAGFSGDNGPATRAQLSAPCGVALDSAGNLYIADTYNNRVRKVSNGVITTVAGNGGTGLDNGGFGGDNGAAASAQLSSPCGVAVDFAGNLYIADTGNSRVRKVSNGVITTVAGTGPNGFGFEPGIIGDNGPATGALLDKPSGIAVDSAGNLYIADGNDALVRKVSNGVITTVAGTSGGFPGETGIASNGLAASVSLAFPGGVAVDYAGNVYIADTGNNRVCKVSNGVVTTVAGDGTPGFSGDDGSATNALLNGPLGVAVDYAGNVYIADSGNNRVRKVSNGVITTVAGNGTAGFSGDNGSATNSQLNNPWGVAVDSAGNLYIADYGNNRVREISSGIITTVAGNGTADFSGDNGPATSAQLSSAGVAIDFAHNLYVADYRNNRVRKVSMGVITTIAGGGSSLGDNGSATHAQLNSPAGVAVDSAANVYIADSGNLSGNQRIRKVSSGVITTIAGGGSSFPANGPATSVDFDSYPSRGSLHGVAVDSVGHVYIADGGYNRIWLLTLSSCTYSVTPTSLQAPASGGNFSVSIQTAASCSWAVSGFLSWVTVSGASSGAGSATVTVVVAANTSGATLNATLSIGGATFTVTQPSSQTYTCTNTAPPVISGVHSAGAYGGYSYFASGSWLEINGTNLADPGDPRLMAAANSGQWTSSDFTGVNAPTVLDGVSVSINGKPAFVWYLSPGQLNVQAPEDAATGNVAITVTNCKATSLPFMLTRQELAPGLLAPTSYSAGGTQYMVATFASDGVYVLNTSTGAAFDVLSRPAKPGDLIIGYGIGFGEVTPSILPGVIVQESNTLVNPVTISFGSTNANILYSGLAGGFVGLYEFYIAVPPGLANGDYQINVTQNGASVPRSMYLTVQN
jgi:uncharacterized protein (TIGR03437 family)